MWGTSAQTEACAFLAWLALTNPAQEAPSAPPVPSAQTQQQRVLSQPSAYATRDTRDRMAARAQLARGIHSKTALAQEHAQPALATLLHHWAEPLALRAWRESTRVAGALWRAQSVLPTRPLQ